MVLGKLFLLFTLVPIVELYLLITIGEVIGAPATLAIVVLTGLLGAALARHEGVRVLRAWQEAVSRAEIPEEGVVSSLLVLVGGVLLVTPGVITDAVGLSLLLRPTRRALAKLLQRRLEHRFTVTTIGGSIADPFAGFGPPSAGGDVIDIQAEDVRERGDDEHDVPNGSRTQPSSAASR